MEAPITKNGYIYIYVANESVADVNVHFDDVAVTLIEGPVTSASDYYPFGLVMEGRSWSSEPYRFGYQGQFSEYDEETGWNAFTLRSYDPVIGRWLSTDPYGQFASPYLGMGNNPVNGIDPDGGWLFGLFGSTSAQRQEMRQLKRDNGGQINNYFSENISWSYKGYEHEVGNSGWTGYDYFTVSVDKEGNLSPVETIQVLSAFEGIHSNFDDLGAILATELAFATGAEFIGLGLRGVIGMAGKNAVRLSERNFVSFMTQNELRAYTYSNRAGVRAMMRGKGVDAAFRYYAQRNIILKGASKLRLIELGSRTFGPDMIGRGLLRGFWWDVTTVGSWSSHALKYTPRYGVGKGLFY